MPTQVKDVQVVLRVPRELADSLDHWVKERGTNRAAFIRELLEQRLNWLWAERDAEIYERCPLPEDTWGWSESMGPMEPWGDDESGPA